MLEENQFVSDITSNYTMREYAFPLICLTILYRTLFYVFRRNRYSGRPLNGLIGSVIGIYVLESLYEPLHDSTVINSPKHAINLFGVSVSPFLILVYVIIYLIFVGIFLALWENLLVSYEYKKTNIIFFVFAGIFYGLIVALPIASLTSLEDKAYLLIPIVGIFPAIYLRRDYLDDKRGYESAVSNLNTVKNEIMNTLNEIQNHINSLSSTQFNSVQGIVYTKCKNDFETTSTEFFNLTMNTDELSEIYNFQRIKEDLSKILSELIALTTDGSSNNKNANSSGPSTTENFTHYFDGCSDIASLKKRRARLVQIYHPDSENGNQDIFREIQEEYEELSKILTT